MATSLGHDYQGDVETCKQPQRSITGAYSKGTEFTEDRAQVAPRDDLADNRRGSITRLKETNAVLLILSHELRYVI